VSRRNPDEDRARRFLESGTESAGGTTGSAIAILLPGPVGVVVGAISSAVITQVLRSGLGEALERQLGEREQARVGAALLVAADQISQRLNRGEQPRQDGFFTARAGYRADAEEVAEGIIRAAQRVHEERKVPYLGYLIATVYFDATISRANALLHQADALTYRQMVLLALVDRYEQRRSDSWGGSVGKRGVWWNLRHGTDSSDTAQGVGRTDGPGAPGARRCDTGRCRE
jgi:hypothetical protein